MKMWHALIDVICLFELQLFIVVQLFSGAAVRCGDMSFVFLIVCVHSVACFPVVCMYVWSCAFRCVYLCVRLCARVL